MIPSEISAPTVRYRPIADAPDYRVGDDGSIWSHRRGEWKRLKPYPRSRGGYLCVCIRGNHRRAHRLILEAFIGPCPEGLECRHLDGVRTNNRLLNLAWGTRLENAQDKREHGTVLCGEQHPGAKLRRRDVTRIRARLAKGDRVKVLAREHHVCPRTIRMIRDGQTWLDPEAPRLAA
jgi:hypothetical protein